MEATMAVHKVKRTNPSAQPQSHHARRRRANNTQTDPLPTPQLFDVLQNLNRGYGTALISLDNLQLINTTSRTRIIPSDCLRMSCRHRGETGQCAISLFIRLAKSANVWLRRSAQDH
jgi:hypothetical protein